MALVLATFNVLDLFDPGETARIDRLASLLRPHAPDVVALQEIGSRAVGEAFGAALGGGYSVVVGDADERGILNALLTRLPIVSWSVLRAESLPYPRFRSDDSPPFDSRIPLRRSVPDVVVDAGALGPLRVLVVHFKSRRATPMRDPAGNRIEPVTTAEMAEGEARAVAWRCAEALFVRRAVDGYLAAAPDAMLAVCGDFNDVVGSLPLRIAAGTTAPERPDALVCCTESIPVAERVSVLHEGEEGGIDHALVSRALAERFAGCFYERSHIGEPEFSDHAPLVVRFHAATPPH